MLYNAFVSLIYQVYVIKKFQFKGEKQEFVF